ncbi:MAG: translation elongation factor Ts [Patescibacteria group bacterium]
MTISASQVAELRQKTGVGMMEAKKALIAVDGDIDKAIEELRKSGAAKAAKKAERVTAEGRAHCYAHATGKIGVVVEVLCETDFVARNELFIEFCNDVAMHIAAMRPLYLTREEVPEELIAKEREILKDQLLQEGKPENMVDQILEGKLNKFFSDIVLFEQPFIKDEDLTIRELLEKKILSLGENLKIHRFHRVEVGEGLV